jgi:hypothetical protein
MFSVERIDSRAAVLVTAVGCASIRGTDSISDTTRTGTIHTVNFEEHMTPANLRVQRRSPLGQSTEHSGDDRVNDALDEVTCQIGFSSLLRRQQETARSTRTTRKPLFRESRYGDV